MCFFFLFGISPREKVIGREMRLCPYCGRETMHTIIVRRMWFTLFFIPLFPVSGKQTIARCTECGFEHSGTAEESRPDLYRPPANIANVCPNCGSEVVPGARFCHHCGHRL